MLLAFFVPFKQDPISTPVSHSSGWKGYDPQRVTGLYPTEVATDYAFVGFGGGRCLKTINRYGDGDSGDWCKWGCEGGDVDGQNMARPWLTIDSPFLLCAKSLLR